MKLMSKLRPKRQTPSGDQRVISPDSLFAVVRRLERRISQLESQQSILRRDVNRIDRKQYRTMELEGPQQIPPQEPRKAPIPKILVDYFNQQGGY